MSYLVIKHSVFFSRDEYKTFIKFIKTRRYLVSYSYSDPDPILTGFDIPDLRGLKSGDSRTFNGYGAWEISYIKLYLASEKPESDCRENPFCFTFDTDCEPFLLEYEKWKLSKELQKNLPKKNTPTKLSKV